MTNEPRIGITDPGSSPYINSPNDQVINNNPPLDFNSIANSLSYISSQNPAATPLVNILTQQLQNYVGSWKYYQQNLAQQTAGMPTGQAMDFMAQQGLQYAQGALQQLGSLITNVLPYLSQQQLLQFQDKWNTQQLNLQRAGAQTQLNAQAFSELNNPQGGAFSQAAMAGNTAQTDQNNAPSSGGSIVTSGGQSPNISNLISKLPQGARVIGSTNGQYAIQLPNGQTYAAQPGGMGDSGFQGTGFDMTPTAASQSFLNSLSSNSSNQPGMNLNPYTNNQTGQTMPGGGYGGTQGPSLSPNDSMTNSNWGPIGGVNPNSQPSTTQTPNSFFNSFTGGQYSTSPQTNPTGNFLNSNNPTNTNFPTPHADNSWMSGTGTAGTSQSPYTSSQSNSFMQAFGA